MISVIIPVYNDAILLPRAVESCLSQMEVSEVIVINDGSIDDIEGALASFTDARLILLHHPDRGNHGRSASRNLGIKTATAEWIAFCDADDYFLPERFAHLDVASDSPADGHYDTIQTAFATAELSTSYPEKITSIPNDILAHQLGNYLIAHREERISILGLVVRRSVLMDVGLFDEELQVGEDTDLIWRLSLDYNLFPGDHTDESHDQPVAVRWVDGSNTYLDTPSVAEHRYTFYKKWHHLQSNYKLSPTATQRINQSYRYYSIRHQYGHWPEWCQDVLRRLPPV